MLLSKKRKLEQELKAASNYEEWRQAAIAYDEATGLDRWKRNDPSREYDYVSIRVRLDRFGVQFGEEARRRDRVRTAATEAFGICSVGHHVVIDVVGDVEL